MKRLRINWIAIAVTALVLVNIGLLATIWLQKKAPVEEERGPRPGDKNPLATQLGFDSAQRLQFDTLRARHFALMQEYRREMRGLKESYFEGIKTGAAPNDSTAQAIAALEVKINRSIYEHFGQVRALCTDNQKGTFDRTLQRIIAAMGKQPPRPRGEHGGRPDGPPMDGPHDRQHDGPPHDGPPEERDGPPPAP